MLAVDTASLCAQIRVEVAGLRGLLALIEWARLRPKLLIARRLQVYLRLCSLTEKSEKSLTHKSLSRSLSLDPILYMFTLPPHFLQDHSEFT